jgi:hypothetical protein
MFVIMRKTLSDAILTPIPRVSSEKRWAGFSPSLYRASTPERKHGVQNHHLSGLKAVFLPRCGIGPEIFSHL